ncbi:hypothetical protein WJX72_008492 [[Myrmecia] bisecta]|uniref:RCC1-like domain-containing protein n=1 Tax=[Myrmecia] bisecta TaxID=41462 RepID=A0AAW1QRJ6_9CHLO
MTDPASTTEPAPEDIEVVSVGCGSSHSVALLSCDAVVSWGRGEDGQLGHGDADERLSAEAVHALQNAGATAVVCGAEYSVAICGKNNEVYSWGWGDFGRLGHGDCNDIFIPQPIAALSGLSVVRVACGDTHTLAVTDTGDLYSFGRNQNGQLGLGNTQDSLGPQLVQALKGDPATSIACGAEHTLVATASGEVYSWGWGRYGNLGDGERQDRWLPTRVTALSGHNIVTVCCGWRHSVALDNGGAIYTFGWSKYGQLGHGNFSDEALPKRVESLRDRQIRIVAGGWRHTVAADHNGQLHSWGWNKFGQLGIQSTVDAATPVMVADLASEDVVQLACGWRHTIAVTRAGQVYSWGRGVNGQLGHGDMRDLSAPKRVENLCKGSINPAKLTQTGQAASAYIPPSDRYAIVPDRHRNALNGGMAVPDILVQQAEAKRQRTAV